MRSTDPTYPLRAVDRVCDILDALADAPDALSLATLAETTALPKSSAFRYLTALESRHYVERDAAGEFRLGPAFRPRSQSAVSRLANLARPALERLRDELGETTNLGVLDGSYVVHAVVAESPEMMRLAARVGERGYVHSTAMGKAICARLPESRVLAILDAAGTPAMTASTLTDAASYLAELARVRARGYGLDEAENQEGGRCVAVALEISEVPASISVSAPTVRFPPERTAEVVARLAATAREICRS